ncbi:MAG: VWA domain-containing protein [Patescibacteria group bacterium]
MITSETMKYKEQKGIALLLAIVISAIILSLGLSISMITSRSYVLSTAVRESQLAYYAGEAGSECARYWGLLNRKNFSNTKLFTIRCNDSTFDFPPTPGQTIFHFEFGHVGYPYYSSTTVTRLPGIFNLDIDAKGYNTVAANATRKYERQQDLKAYGICSYRPDIMFVLDVSSSIDAAEFADMKSALNTLVETLNPTDLGVHVGIVVFGGDTTLVQHLTGVKADILNTISTGLQWPRNFTNLQEALRFGKAELSNQPSPNLIGSRLSNTGDNYYYCPLAGGPNRAVVTFPAMRLEGSTTTMAAGVNPYDPQPTDNPQPTIPPGKYNIYIATADTWANPLTPTTTPPVGRETETQPGERVRLELYVNPNQAGTPFFTTNPTDDVPDFLRFGAVTTLVGENVQINQTAQSFLARHYPTPSCGVGCDNSVVMSCAVFEKTDTENGNLNTATLPYYDSHDRPDETSPDYIIVVTDGSQTAYRSALQAYGPPGADGNGNTFSFENKKGRGMVKTNGADGSTNDPSPSNHNSMRRRAAQTAIAYEADLIRSFGIDIFVIGVGLGNDCWDYAGCGDFLSTEAASFAEPNTPDPDGNAFYFDAANYGELDTVLSQIVNCVHPLAD